jgi:uncharacterized repeat protein (TIGR03803 family)
VRNPRRSTTGIVSIFLVAFAGFAPSLMAKETILHRFLGGGDGTNPQAGLISDGAGNLYGTTYYGGTGACNVNNEFLGCGTVFVLTPSPQGGWTETVLYSFQDNSSDGQGPVGGLVRDGAGNLYGTTSGGGQVSCGYGGCGVIFEVTPPAVSGEGWTETILYNFQGGSDGEDPRSGLIFDGAGALYGTTKWGGNMGGSCANFAIGCGTVYKLEPPSTGGTWTHTVLYRFKPNDDGQQPEAVLVFDSSGALYGTTTWGGYYSTYCEGCGTVFELSPEPAQSSEEWNEAVIWEFKGDDGASPLGGVTLDSRGNVYGTTSVGSDEQGEFNGTVFALSPPGEGGKDWSESVLHRFGVNGGPAYPAAGVVLDSKGNIYGTTEDGGSASFGTVFRLSRPAGQNGNWRETTLHEFTGGNDGSYPEAPVILVNSTEGKGVALFGTTYDGGGTACSRQGYNNCGVVFEIRP